MSWSTDMTGKAKFLFDRTFDEPMADGAARPAPRFTAKDLDAARERGFIEGRQQGIAASQAETEAATLAALRAIERTIADLLRQQQDGVGAMRETAASLGLAVGRKLSVNFMRLAPAEEVAEVIRRCIDEQREEPRLVVRASDGVIEALKASIDAIVAEGGFPGQIVLLPDDRLAAGDCRVEWADGGAIRDQSALADRIAEIVMREARADGR